MIHNLEPRLWGPLRVRSCCCCPQQQQQHCTANSRPALTERLPGPSRPQGSLGARARGGAQGGGGGTLQTVRRRTPLKAEKSPHARTGWIKYFFHCSSRSSPPPPPSGATPPSNQIGRRDGPNGGGGFKFASQVNWAGRRRLPRRCRRRRRTGPAGATDTGPGSTRSGNCFRATAPQWKRERERETEQAGRRRPAQCLLALFAQSEGNSSPGGCRALAFNVSGSRGRFIGMGRRWSGTSALLLLPGAAMKRPP